MAPALTQRVRHIVGSVGRFAEIRLERLLIGRPHHTPAPVDRVVADLARTLNVDLAEILHESDLCDIEGDVVRGIAWLRQSAALKITFNADIRLARFCYALCRAVGPEAVVETGVAYGVTSAFILKALNKNGAGVLHSVDAPPWGVAAQTVGALIPEELRGRWRLYPGTSDHVLPTLLPTVGRVGMFLHDSRHTYRVVRRELGAVRPFLAPGAAVVVDDVQKNVGFQRWVAQWPPAYSGVVPQQDKQGLFGIGIMPRTTGD